MRHIDSWDITLRVAEYEDQTRAEVGIETGNRRLFGHGRARLTEGDVYVPEIGDRLAVGRALIALGDELVERAMAEVADRAAEQREAERHPVPATTAA